MEAGEEARRAGRNLVGMSKTGTTITYTYNKDGIRTSKTVNGVTTNYTLSGDMVTSETNNTNTIYYRYDANDNLISMNLNGTEYYYFYNSQGDIIGLFDRLGNVVVEYAYDAWGKILCTTGSLASTVGMKNPYRYRGYRYDDETGLYYLQSRYYSPVWGRFIIADDVTEQLDYTYCNNNPINAIDPTGHAIRLWDKVWDKVNKMYWYANDVKDFLSEVAVLGAGTYKYASIFLAYALMHRRTLLTYDVNSDLSKIVLKVIKSKITDEVSREAQKNKLKYYTFRDSYIFSSGDLHYALNKVNINFSAQYDRNLRTAGYSAWRIVGCVKDYYDFSSFWKNNNKLGTELNNNGYAAQLMRVISNYNIKISFDFLLNLKVTR